MNNLFIVPSDLISCWSCVVFVSGRFGGENALALGFYIHSYHELFLRIVSPNLLFISTPQMCQ